MSEFREPTQFEQAALIGLQKVPGTNAFRKQWSFNGRGTRIIRERHIYGGTVPAGIIRARRVKAKAARKSRRINRITAQR